MIGKDGSTASSRRCRQLFLQVTTVEDVVAQHQRTGSGADELFTQNKGLSQPVRAWLDLCIASSGPTGYRHPVVAQSGSILRRADDQNIGESSPASGC